MGSEKFAELVAFTDAGCSLLIREIAILSGANFSYLLNSLAL